MDNNLRIFFKRLKICVKETPILGTFAKRFYLILLGRPPSTKSFLGSEKYWEERYADGGTSGAGSYGKLARFKAEVVNTFIIRTAINSVIEFGCGDGNQLTYMNFPQYLGFDVSESAILMCRKRFSTDKTKSFRLMNEYNNEEAELTLSMDVIYHLVEDEVFETYITTLFNASTRYVVIYSSNIDDNFKFDVPHVRHRKFTEWVQQNFENWQLIHHKPNKYEYTGDHMTSSFADFFIYEKTD